MSIRLYDSLRKTLVPFEPRKPGRVSMYACGPTVYNYIHIGNARSFIWFDMIRRYLEYRGFEVVYVSNYTDVDDKIIERAKLEELPTEAITSKYTKAYEEDMAALEVRPPDITAKATDNIGNMVEAIEGLIAKGSAYAVEGDVFFDVSGFESYGKLSGRSREDLQSGDRIEQHPSKRNPLDFALWKSAKEGEPSWPSPWGPGRPGWHIECSVMSTKYLGMGFDIHAGGSDLTFPHHENEIAQAEALAEAEPFARLWLHTGMVQMESEKMSKSIGNVVLAKDVAARFGGGASRYWALMSSYRSQPVFSDAALADAIQAYERWKTFDESVRHALGDRMPETPKNPRRAEDVELEAPGYVARFIEAMDDDLNSAGAFAVIHDLVREGNRRLESAQRGDEDEIAALVELVEPFLELTAVLGFDFSAGGADSEVLGGLLDYLLELREQARAEKAFDRADAIRSRLTSLGVTIEDTAAGPRWRLGTADALAPEDA